MKLAGETVFHQGDDVRLAASAWGDPSAPPVCFFHGGGQSRRAWRNAAAAIADAGYYSLSFDLRGHGDSAWAPDGDYLLDAYARDVETLLDRFEQSVTLVGASRGGQAALVGGSRRQNKVRLLMLADVAPSIVEQNAAPILAFLRASVSGFDDVEAAADALAAYLNQPRATDTGGLRKAMRERDGRLYWHWDPMSVSPEFLNPPSESMTMIAAAEIFRQPIVLVRAEHGSLVSEAGVAHFQTLTPQLVVEQAAGTHHMFTGDDNEIFSVRLLHFLAATAP